MNRRVLLGLLVIAASVVAGATLHLTITPKPGKVGQCFFEAPGCVREGGQAPRPRPKWVDPAALAIALVGLAGGVAILVTPR